MGNDKLKIIVPVVLIAIAGVVVFWRPSVTRITIRNSSSIVGVVVPHHNIVAIQRADLFDDLIVRGVRPQTVILLSPNHYSAGHGAIQTTDQVWHLADSEIQPNQSVINSLLSGKLATNEPASFVDEHGIYNILDDIKTHFPDANIVPLIFEPAAKEKLLALEHVLEQSCATCLMIASVDFSHYQPALLAQLHDDRSIRDLEALDTDDLLTGAEVDSGPALALLSLWAESHHSEHFNLQNHTNSGVIAENPDIESTTHVFGWYESGPRVEPNPEVSFIIGGDMMFARMINNTFKNNFSAALTNLGDRVFWGTDASIINLEGAITTQPIPDNQGETFVFHFSPDITKALTYLHINVASMANNHSDNAGDEGIATTQSALKAANIQPFGGPRDSSVSQVAQIHGIGLNLTIIGINLTFPDTHPESIVPIIAQYKQDPAMRILVMPHWGVEYNPGHTSDQAAAAHLWIDAGADAVIGSHPHVIEDAELYHNVPIIYSLGNLLFDQTFSRATQEGLLIAGKFTSSGLTLFGLPTQSINYKPQLTTGNRKQTILNSLYAPFKNYLVETAAGSVVQLNKK